MNPSRRVSRRVRRPGVVVLFAGLAAGLMSGCGGADAAKSGGRAVIEVQLGRYTIMPAALTVPVGKSQLHVTNTDGMVHDLVVAGRGTRQLAPGESQKLSIEVDAGRYKMWCDVPGHAAMGQTGVLNAVAIDVADPATSSTASTSGP